MARSHLPSRLLQYSTSSLARGSGSTGPTAFNPSAVTIAVNGTVQWNWAGGNVLPHNVTFAGEDALTMKPGESVTRSFPTAGTFDYLCSLHPRDMTGTVSVEG